jgi:hypothetical protein
MTARSLSPGELGLARSVFGDAIDYDRVQINHRKWIFFQPRHVAMAPDGHLWFHPKGTLYCDDFCAQHLTEQGLFIHEMTHVWQRQAGIYLPLRRHPFCRYSYTLKPGWPLRRYGLEQQAEIVRHAFLMRNGYGVPGAPSLQQYESILPFWHG